MAVEKLSFIPVHLKPKTFILSCWVMFETLPSSDELIKLYTNRQNTDIMNYNMFDAFKPKTDLNNI